MVITFTVRSHDIFDFFPNTENSFLSDHGCQNTIFGDFRHHKQDSLVHPPKQFGIWTQRRRFRFCEQSNPTRWLPHIHFPKEQAIVSIPLTSSLLFSFSCSSPLGLSDYCLASFPPYFLILLLHGTQGAPFGIKDQQTWMTFVIFWFQFWKDRSFYPIFSSFLRILQGVLPKECIFSSHTFPNSVY